MRKGLGYISTERYIEKSPSLIILDFFLYFKLQEFYKKFAIKTKPHLDGGWEEIEKNEGKEKKSTK